MANDVLAGVAQDLSKLNEQIAVAQELIDAAREAGEEVGQWEGKLKTLLTRKAKWERMLANRGYTVPK